MPDYNKNDFSGNPVRLDTPRSKFNMPFKHKTTFKAGMLIPIWSYGDVMPGDTFKVDLACLVRMATPVFPTMDDAYLDVYFFFTPHKLVLSREMMSPSVNDANRSWNAFIGAQDSFLNVPTPGDVMLPFVSPQKDVGGDWKQFDIGSLADYLGIGRSYSYQDGDWEDTLRIGISCLEPLAYYSIWNNYFRDENTMQPVAYSLWPAETADSIGNPDLVGRSLLQLTGFDGDDTARWGDSQGSIGLVDSILPVCRPHGYFGSCLPWPQRNSTQVSIPLDFLASVSPVGQLMLAGETSEDEFGLQVSNGVDHIETDIVPQEDETLMYRSGLGLKVSRAGLLVNQLRLSVQTQRFYEALARGGNRIGELTASMFGVTPSDLAQDRPEYLGGKRIPLSMDQVANTAGNLGTLGAFSNTGDSAHYFEKSFDTWGTITCVVCVRTNETFCQGLPRRYSRKERLDFYWPQFANLGEQPVRSREIFIEGGTTAEQKKENYVFGYQEAWAEYRFLPDTVSGYLRPAQSLGAYTYANNFTGAPDLAGYIDGTKIADNIDRTLVVPGSTSGFQFIGDFSFKIVATRPMPLYSIPGLVDHH